MLCSELYCLIPPNSGGFFQTECNQLHFACLNNVHIVEVFLLLGNPIAEGFNVQMTIKWWKVYMHLIITVFIDIIVLLSTFIIINRTPIRTVLLVAMFSLVILLILLIGRRNEWWIHLLRRINVLLLHYCRGGGIGLYHSIDHVVPLCDESPGNHHAPTMSDWLVLELGVWNCLLNHCQPSPKCRTATLNLIPRNGE